jgi:predicted metal-binding protein
MLDLYWTRSSRHRADIAGSDASAHCRTAAIFVAMLDASTRALEAAFRRSVSDYRPGRLRDSQSLGSGSGHGTTAPIAKTTRKDVQVKMMHDGSDRPHILYICRTCPRYERLPPPGEKTRGMTLVEALRALAENSALAGKYKIIGAHCLNGCPSPCNVVLASCGKTRLRFHRLGPDDAASVLDLALLYYGMADGDISAGRLSSGLGGRLAAAIPPLDQSGRPLRPGAARVPE